ncbi:hypothetical protein JW905_13885 [bacterium]|nr:hypothetical protein [candidate division CSSED10-310 bacterium]
MKPQTAAIRLVVLSTMLGLCFRSHTLAYPIDWAAPEEVLSGTAAEPGSLALEAGIQSEFHVVYLNQDTDHLVYGRQHANWVCGEIDGPAFTDQRDVALLLWGDLPVTLYDHQVNEEMKLAAADGWTPFAITGTGGAIDSRLALSPAGVVHIFWSKPMGEGSQLILTFNQGLEWRSEVIAWLDTDTPLFDLAMDPDGRACFAWHDPVEGLLWYAKRWGSGDMYRISFPRPVEIRWLKLDMLADSTAFISLLERLAPDSQRLSCWYDGRMGWTESILSEERSISCVDMAIAGHEGIYTKNVYFAYLGDRGITFVFFASWWERAIIMPVSAPVAVRDLALALHPVTHQLGLLLAEEDGTTLRFYRGTPDYSDPVDLDLTLWINQPAFRGGDTMEVNLEVFNPGRERYMDTYVVLDACGQQWFYPAWSTLPDYRRGSIPAGGTCMYPLLESVLLPPELAPGGPYFFYAACFTAGYLNASALVSSIVTAEFGFQ